MPKFEGMRFPTDAILICNCWHVAYPLGYQPTGEMMEKRGPSVDHSSINRWGDPFLAAH